MSFEEACEGEVKKGRRWGERQKKRAKWEKIL